MRVGGVASYPSIVLASGSPRRRELLESAGVAFTVVSADIDESPLPEETPAEMVVRLAIAKAHAVVGRAPSGAAILAADTTVDIDGATLGKPESAEDAQRMLGLLSNRWHLVHSGVCLLGLGPLTSFRVTTEVRFTDLRVEDIERYIATGEPVDRAGAYAMQGGAAGFVAEIRGSVTNVIGLPLAETLAALRDI